MYNLLLNETHINRLRNYVKNKKVLLLGNSISLFGDKTGEFIDSFDVVVRVGKGNVRPEIADYIGRKFDVWSFGGLRSFDYRDYSKVKFKIYNYLQINFYTPAAAYLQSPKFMYNGDFQIYKDFFLLGNYSELQKYRKFVLGEDTTSRLSQGILTLCFLFYKIRTFSELHLYGFDFFNSTVDYDYLDKGIRRSYSWHLPASKDSDINANPHNIEAEEKYVRLLESKNKLIFHPCPTTPINNNVLQELFNKYRPGGSVIKEE